MFNITKKVAMIALASTLVSFGCSEKAPMDPALSAGIADQTNGLKFVNLLPAKSLNREATNTDSERTDRYKIVKALITPEDGGLLRFRLNGDNVKSRPDLAGVNVQASFKVRPGAVTEAVEIWLKIDYESFAGGVAMDYGPHGLVFSRPAILNVSASGLDFSRLTDSQIADLGFYYVNQESGIWEPIPHDDLIVDAAAGSIELERGKLPHFSRYAIAHSQ